MAQGCANTRDLTLLRLNGHCGSRPPCTAASINEFHMVKHPTTYSPCSGNSSASGPLAGGVVQSAQFGPTGDCSGTPTAHSQTGPGQRAPLAMPPGNYKPPGWSKSSFGSSWPPDHLPIRRTACRFWSNRPLDRKRTGLGAIPRSSTAPGPEEESPNARNYQTLVLQRTAAGMSPGRKRSPRTATAA